MLSMLKTNGRVGGGMRGRLIKSDRDLEEAERGLHFEVSGKYLFHLGIHIPKIIMRFQERAVLQLY